MTASPTPPARSCARSYLEVRAGFAATDLVAHQPIADDEGSEWIRFSPGGFVMASDLIDLTLPAHDPSFPKPRGLLPVPPEVAESVARLEAQILRELGAPMTPEARQRELEYGTTNWYFDNTEIAYRRTPQGIEVMAVGSEEVSQFLKDHPLETRRGVVIRVA
jgi:hypothetical protein